VTGAELDREAKSELKTLPKDLAIDVARHLVMVGRLLDEDADQAYQHAMAARRLAARVGVVREACGLAAYHVGEWSVALSELRAARRITGQEAYLAIMADAERGLARPERALDLARSDEAKRLPQPDKIEMRIVESGARRDLGQYDAAVLALQLPELRDERLRPWSARLFYAYAEALADADRDEEASDWFARAAAADREGETDAAERYAELAGLEIIDTEDLEVFEDSTDLDFEDLPPEATSPETGPPPAERHESDTLESGPSDPASPELHTTETGLPKSAPKGSDSPETDLTQPDPQAADLAVADSPTADLSERDPQAADLAERDPQAADLAESDPPEGDLAGSGSPEIGLAETETDLAETGSPHVDSAETRPAGNDSTEGASSETDAAEAESPNADSPEGGSPEHT
jgi:hypothetical protein